MRVGHAGPEVLHEDVGALDQVLEHAEPFRCLEVERERALVAVDGGEDRGHAAALGPEVAHEVAAVGILDLDDVGALIAEELGGERARHHGGELEDGVAVEWAGHGAVYPGLRPRKSS